MTYSLQFSPRTREILKNISQIAYKGVIFRDGHKIWTNYEAEDPVILVAELEEEFLSEFGIYDLKRFLAALSRFKNPTIEIGEDAIFVKEGNACLRYNMTSVGWFDHNLSWEDVQSADKNTDRDAQPKLEISQETLRNVSDMAAIMDLDRVEFRAEKGIVTFGTHANDMALRSGETDNYFVEVGRVPNDVNYHVAVHANRFRVILPGDYIVTVSTSNGEEGIVRFVGIDVTYYVPSLLIG